jgi:ribonuclease BN (tRNA processing enzyme)
MAMNLTIAGCGSGAPDGERVCSGYLVEGEDVVVLLDCGPGVVHSMARHGMPWQNITYLVLSHFHNDHIGDVPYLFFALKHGVQQPREEPLTIIGPKGTRRMVENMAQLFGDHMRDPGFTLRVREITPAPPGEAAAESAERQLELGPAVRLTATRARHTDEALAYRLDSHASSLGYTGDTGYDEDVAAFLKGVDLAICECALPDEEAMETHLTPEQLARMAGLMQPGRIVVTHAYPQLDRKAVPKLLKKHGWKGKAIVAADGLQVTVRE